MKLTLTLLALILSIYLGQGISVLGQTIPDSFFVKNTFIETDANPRFVRRFVDNIISWNKESNNYEINCLKNEMTKTRLFENIETKIEKTDESKNYNLDLIVRYKTSNLVFRISKIKTTGFKNMDVGKFNASVNNKLIKKTLNLKTDFPRFENLIIESVRESLQPQDLENFQLPWLDIRLNSTGELEVLVLPMFKKCIENSK